MRMRVLSTDEFVKKIYKCAEEGYIRTPTIEVLPNWQLRLSLPVPGESPEKFLGPRIDEIEQDDYIVFLSQVDDYAKSSLAVAFVQDLNQG
jgi:hypothetical protein